MISAELIEQLNKRASSIAPIGGTLKLSMGDMVFYLDGTGVNNQVSNEDKPADCSISMTEKAFQKLTKGELNPMMAVMTGKIKIKGDMSLAMKLQELIG